MHLAVLLEDAKGCSKLIDRGAEVSDAVREAAFARRSLREMFGGESPITLEEISLEVEKKKECLRHLKRS